ncbi:hypothetical protein CEE45_08100 [Candidatus Heimdallarchaeota archaeon B3_Heim]|nr:MAG: hypothetical protein CEE45_08100 [Candidatus Heimdallarchaeota archaeon B3_Heim]
MGVSELEGKLKDLIDLDLVKWKSVSNRLDELKLLKNMLNSLDDQKRFKEFRKLIKALNHPARIQILIAINEGVICACELEYLTDLAQATVSHHLSLLEDADIITRSREGKRNFLSIKNQQVIDYFMSF